MGVKSDKKKLDEAWNTFWSIVLIVFLVLAVCIGIAMLLIPAGNLQYSGP